MEEKNSIPKKIKLSFQNQMVLSIEINDFIQSIADESSEKIYNGEISKNILPYPPDNESIFTDEEMEVLKKLEDNQIIKSTLKKVIADASAFVMFNFLNLIDGTGDPDLTKWKGYDDNWAAGICLIDRPFTEDGELADFYEEPEEMLHDTLFDAYHEWKEIKKNKDLN